MANFTPGPWIAGGLMVRSDNGIICACPTPQNGGTFDCSQNTELIAAAPQLLEALKEVIAISDRKHDYWDKAKAAIAKAEGLEIGRE